MSQSGCWNEFKAGTAAMVEEALLLESIVHYCSVSVVPFI